MDAREDFHGDQEARLDGGLLVFHFVLLPLPVSRRFRRDVCGLRRCS